MLKLMRSAWDSWWCRAILFYCLTAFTISLFLGPTRCRDGWHSLSIGERGACSHHGGVDRSRGSLINLVALIIAGGAAYRAYDKGQQAELRQRLKDKGIHPDAPQTISQTKPPPEPYVPPPIEPPSEAAIEAGREGEQRTKDYMKAYSAEMAKKSPTRRPRERRKR